MDTFRKHRKRKRRFRNKCGENKQTIGKFGKYKAELEIWRQCRKSKAKRRRSKKKKKNENENETRGEREMEYYGIERWARNK